MELVGKRPATAVGWRDARELAAGLARPVDSEHVGLDRAYNRVLAAAVTSRTLVPGYDAAAMDGYAYRGEGPWQVVGQVLAGEGSPAPLAAGTAVEIATGAWVPPNTDGVLPYEDCGSDGVLVAGVVPAKPHIRRAGEDLCPDDPLARPGQTATAALLGLLAHGGHDRVSVYRRVRALVVVTGDEVVRSGLPAAGQVRDALGPLVSGYLAGHDADAEVVQVADSREALAAAVLSGTADVVVVTGSSSVGRADHLHPVLRGLEAKLHVDGVACRPGQPQLLASLAGGRWVVGLPGNPFAGLVACLTLLGPLLDGLAGRERSVALTLPLRGPVPAPGGLTRLVPVRLSGGTAEFVTDAGPARLRAAAGADAIAVVEPGWTPDRPVEVLPL